MDPGTPIVFVKMSASFLVYLAKAILWPSGKKVGDSSKARPLVTRCTPEPSTFIT